MLDIVSPDQWAMPPVTRPVDTRQLSVVDEANVHHSDSSPATNHASCGSQVRGFDAYHRNRNGWACIGYHRVICPHAVVFLGRALRVIPAAALGHNTPIVAYCLIAKNGRATDAQLQALIEMAAHDAHHIGRPLRWTTHREVWPHTDCPGDAIQGQINALRLAHGPTTFGNANDAAVGIGAKRRAEADDLATVLERKQSIERGRGVLRRLGRAIRKALS